ncbi:MAG TPA: septal ring lytic transglycosylase RlpA family protein [Thermoanaerobaculia bacterium]|nr:septal ring lytic transglycosylase RlpA family protein [Thermoanaerobaculia bacterium]
MKSRVWSLAALVVLAYGCATTAPSAPEKAPDTLHGVASWYGEEFAGRTTANGEIFDPSLLTAAHRTLPFGTVLDITNPKTAQSVRVRVNDRGPYIGNRVIDLSYAAAQQIGLIEPGIGPVDIRIVRVGSGEREPPAPFDITLAEAPKTAPVRSAGDPPPIAFPLPNQPAPAPAAVAPSVVSPEAVVDRVDVVVQRGDVITRKQVTPDGKSFEEVPLEEGQATTASSYDEQRRDTARREAVTPRKPQQFFVQVGAFSVEANAKALQERLTAIGHRALIAYDALYRVRIGPYQTRDAAIEGRTALEAQGISALIVSE